MARNRQKGNDGSEPVLSIVGPGMVIHGDVVTPGSLRVEGHIRGRVWAGKAVVIGRDGCVEGDLLTRDAVVGGRVEGTLHASSRLEVQSTAVLSGEVRTPRLALEDGARLDGDVGMGEVEMPPPPEGLTSDGRTPLADREAQGTGSS